jgi:hypothetical protein
MSEAKLPPPVVPRYLSGSRIGNRADRNLFVLTSV